MPNNIEYKIVTRQWVEKLAQFFEDIIAKKEDDFFHPHPLNLEAAKEIASFHGQDLYFLQIRINQIAGYGMLRGWDEGYSVPSLGIAIHPSFRRQGLAKKFMDFMHDQARGRGAKKVRLTVYANNIYALQLYRNFGYSFSDEKDGQVVGFFEL